MNYEWPTMIFNQACLPPKERALRMRLTDHCTAFYRLMTFPILIASNVTYHARLTVLQNSTAAMNALVRKMNQDLFLTGFVTISCWLLVTYSLLCDEIWRLLCPSQALIFERHFSTLFEGVDWNCYKLRFFQYCSWSHHKELSWMPYFCYLLETLVLQRQTIHRIHIVFERLASDISALDAL